MRLLPWLGLSALGLLLSLSLAGCGSDDPMTPDPPANRRPRIDSFEALSAQEAQIDGEIVPLRVTVSDPDGDAITITWALDSGSLGSLSTTTGDSTAWTAPAGAGLATVIVTVSDGELEASSTRVLVAGTEAPQNIAGTVTWALADSPIVITDDVLVESDATLNIEAGVEIFFRKKLVNQQLIRVGMVVQGTLNAMGTTGQRIIFEGSDVTDVTAAQHMGIKLELTGQAVLRHMQIFEADVGINNTGSGDVNAFRCRVRSSGGGYRGGANSTALFRRCEFTNIVADAVLVQGGGVTLVGCELEDNVVGLALRGAAVSSADVDSCEFDSNEATNIFLSSAATLSVDSCNMFEDGENGINVEFDGSGGAIVPLTNCWWGPLDAGSEQDQISSTFRNASARSWEVAPWAGAPINIPAAP